MHVPGEKSKVKKSDAHQNFKTQKNITSSNPPTVSEEKLPVVTRRYFKIYLEKGTCLTRWGSSGESRTSSLNSLSKTQTPFKRWFAMRNQYFVLLMRDRKKGIEIFRQLRPPKRPNRKSPLGKNRSRPKSYISKRTTSGDQSGDLGKKSWREGLGGKMSLPKVKFYKRVDKKNFFT